MSDDFELRGEEKFFALPYIFEPEYTEDEIRQMEETAAATHTSQASGRRRSNEMWWCTCGKCQPLPTEEESRCCLDWTISIPPLESVGESLFPSRCITGQNEFPRLLSNSVLRGTHTGREAQRRATSLKFERIVSYECTHTGYECTHTQLRSCSKSCRGTERHVHCFTLNVYYISLKSSLMYILTSPCAARYISFTLCLTA
ncbi:hypothetical protein DPX16_10249 [Anabarilius grahami]|uniref:Uncharacterized protein n=1 Tax=Anabarilius grahami TaxID=495550 RepID=A0A3N0Y1G8_ANAGA|nr:hypothetical protein DPX16_10249 [Anabarilius grahami]